MLDNQIVESVRDNLVNNSCSLQNAFKDGIIMQAENDGSVSLVLNNQKTYLTYIPCEDENNKKIHGTKRKTLAKLFVNTYTLEELKIAYIEKIKAEQEKQERHIKSFEYMQELSNELYPLFQGYGRLEAKHNYSTCIAELEYIYKSISVDKYNNYSDRITFKLIDNNYYIKHVNFNFCQSGTTKEYQYTLNKLKSFIAELIEDYKTIESAEKIKIAELQKIQDRKIKIMNIASKICNDKENVYILKYNKSLTAINNNLKWATGEGKMGKYMHTNYFKIADMIQKKGITQIAIVLKDIYNSESYISANYININSLS